ncbi:MAG: hypothetical protein ABSG63_11040 [Spirochaetia bacterium]|jgi:hypothetical protein
MSGNSSTGREGDDIERAKRLLADVRREGKELARTGRELTEAGEHAADMATAAQEALSAYPSIAGRLIPPFQMVRGYLAGVSKVVDSGTLTSATTSLGSSMAFLAIGYEGSIVGARREALDHLQAIAQRGTSSEEVVSLMRTFGLDEPYAGEESPLTQFQAALAAFARPPIDDAPATLVLIPLRSCIGQAIDVLNKRKPTQEPCRNDGEKLRSMGRQLARPGFTKDLAESWAADWSELNDTLSGAKTKAFSRDDCQRLLSSGQLLLKSILGGLDPSKLRAR